MGNTGASWFVYTLFVVIAGLALLEIAVRVWGYSERYLYDPIYMPFDQSSEIPFVHKPLLRNARARSSTWYNTDSLGLRSASPLEPVGRKGANEYRIAFVGNSTTFGQGVNTEATFCVRTEKLLKERVKGINGRAFNFGTSGYSVKEMATTVERRALQVNPDLIVVCASFDDFDTTRCGGVDRWGYNVSYTMNGHVDKNSLLKWGLRSVHLAYVLRDIIYHFEQKGGLEANSTEMMPASVPASYNYVQRIHRVAEKNKVPWIFIASPTSDCGGERFAAVLRRCADDSIDVLDLSYMGKGIPPALYNVGKYDSHPSALVHSKIAEALAAYIITHRVISSSLVH